jgi:glucose/mannose transport system permease protein
VFVYGLIAWTINLSLQDKHNARPSKGFVGVDNYTYLFTDDINDRFVHSLKNLGVFTVVFIGGALLLGVFWAFLLERGVRGESIFRTIYLFPMAVSFVASGVVWRWLMNSGTGDNAEVWGRPAGVAVAKDGSLLVSEDGNGNIWRVSYAR